MGFAAEDALESSFEALEDAFAVKDVSTVKHKVGGFTETNSTIDFLHFPIASFPSLGIRINFDLSFIFIVRLVLIVWEN
jgi:hypothetical protein